MTAFFNSAVDEDPAVQVYSTRTLVFYVHLINPNTTDVFCQMFDALIANVIVGTTVPTYSFIIPGGSGASNRGAFEQEFAVPLQFNTALSIAVTTGATTNGAPGSDAVVNIGYLAG